MVMSSTLDQRVRYTSFKDVLFVNQISVAKMKTQVFIMNFLSSQLSISTLTVMMATRLTKELSKRKLAPRTNHLSRTIFVMKGIKTRKESALLNVRSATKVLPTMGTPQIFGGTLEGITKLGLMDHNSFTTLY